MKKISLQRFFVCDKIDVEGYDYMSPKRLEKKDIQKEKYIDPKRYLYAILILVGGILLVFYIFSWYQIKKEEKLMNSYLISTNTIESSIQDLNSLNQVKQEFPSAYFLYLSYTGDEDVYNFELELKRVIDKYKINDIFYYVNLTDLKNNNDKYLDEIKNKLEISNIEKIPAIIYVKDGKITNSNILDGVKDTNLKVQDFEKLLEIYEFEAIN